MSVFVVALSAEARPIIDKLKLKRSTDRPWKLYSSDTNHLLVTGISSLNSAAACAWLCGHKPSLSRLPWINVGVAGHRTHPVGSIFWIEKILTKSGAHYPALHAKHTMQSESLLTVDLPCENYPESELVDMEGAGFYQSCLRFVPIELLHLVKIVSDNQTQPLSQLTKETVTQHVHNNLTEILEFSKQLSLLAACLPEENPEDLESCVAAYQENWRFSHSQTLSLQKTLCRYYALTNTLIYPKEHAEKAENAKEILLMLENLVRRLPAVFR